MPQSTSNIGRTSGAWPGTRPATGKGGVRPVLALVAALSIFLVPPGPANAQPPMAVTVRAPSASPAPAVAGEPADAVAPAFTRTQERASVWAELEKIERSAFVPKETSLDRLHLLSQDADIDPPARLEAIELLLEFAGDTWDAALRDQLLEQLGAWPHGNTSEVARMVALYGSTYYARRTGDLKTARHWVEQIPARLSPTLPLSQKLRLLLVKSETQAETDGVDRALASAAEAEALVAGTDDLWWKAIIRNNSAWADYRAQQLDQAKAINAQALEMAAILDSPALLFRLHTTRGILYEDDLQVSSDEDAVALRYARRTGNGRMLAQAIANASDGMLRHHRFAEALSLATEGKELARRDHTWDSEIVASFNEGIARIGLGQADAGKALCRASISAFEANGQVRTAVDLWEEYGDYLESFGDYAGAIEAFLTYRRQIDLLMQDETRKAIVEEQERAADEQRTRETELVNRDRALKAEQLREHSLRTRLWIALTGCILLSGALAFLAMRRARKTHADLASTNELLHTQSEQDSLTGLANRRHVQSVMQGQVLRSGGYVGSLFLLDIDHFKQINDRFGHAAGDAVLVEVARRLRRASREKDVVVRWGGEEFVVITGSADIDGARGFARRLLEEVGATPVLHGGRAIAVTISIGYACFPLAPNELRLEWDRALDLVDVPMYMAKAHGRNRAYGIEAIDVHSADEARLAAQELEQRWQAGQARLALVPGPLEEVEEVA